MANVKPTIGAGVMHPRIRLGVASVALMCFCLGAWAILRSAPSEVGGTTLVVTAAVLGILVALPELPTKFSVREGSFEFGRTQAAELMDVLDDGLDEDQLNAVKRILQDSMDRRSFQALEEAERDRSDEVPYEEGVLQDLEKSLIAGGLVSPTAGADGGVRRNVVVSVGGRGRPPVLDAAVKIGGKNVGIEIKDRWTPSISRLTAQRLKRVLKANYSAAIVIVPASRVSDVEEDLGDLNVVATSPQKVSSIVPRLKMAL